MSSVLSSANASNPAVKRIMREYAEFAASYSAARESSSPIDVVAAPLDDNLFEWHFTLRGPPGSVYAGGLYHGRVLLPSNYPFRPPDIVMLTPSGRFETGKKICLSISSYHPNNWQPSWSIRTALTALSAFFTTPAAGAIGSLDYPDREKQQLAAKSAQFVCPHCKLSNASIINKHSHAPLTAAGDSEQQTNTQPQLTQPSLVAAAAAAASNQSTASRDSPDTPLSHAIAHSNSPPLPATTAAAQQQPPPTRTTPLVTDTVAQSGLSSLEPKITSTTATPSLAASSVNYPPTASLPSPAPSSVSSSTAPLPPSSAAASFASSSSASSSSSAVAPTATAVSASAVRPAVRSSRLSALTVSLAVLVCAVLCRKLIAHLINAHPSHASIVLNSL